MTRRIVMIKGLLVPAVLALLVMTCGDAAAQKPTAARILSGPVAKLDIKDAQVDRKSTRLNSSHSRASRMPSSA